MSTDNVFDRLTAICLWGGLALGLVGATTYNGFLNPLLQAYLGIFGLERRNETFQDFGTVIAVILPGLAGAAVLYASASIERGDVAATQRHVGWFGSLLVLALVSIAIVNMAHGAMDQPGAGAEVIVVGLIGLIMMIPAGIGWWAMFPVATGLVAGGILCLPRLLLYSTTRHPLRTAWDKSEDGTGITPTEIAQALGQPAQNTTQAVKLKHDLARLEKDIVSRHKELAEEREQLRSAILGDAERFETEKRMAKILIDLETLNTEVEAYRKYLQQRGKGS